MSKDYILGLPMLWGRALPIPGVSKYLVTDKGLVVSLRFRRPKVLKPGTKHGGRAYVNIYVNDKYRSEYVHRLVAFAFLGLPKPGQEVNHIDGDKTNNKPENLEWCTRAENIRHAFRVGLNRGHGGEENNNAKLTIGDVNLIRSLHYKVSQAALAEQFNVSKTSIKRIHSGISWRTLNEVSAR